MKLVIPDNNDPSLPVAVGKLVRQPSNHEIKEIYGKPTENKVIGSGRANIFFEDINRKEMEKRVCQFLEMGIEYNYTLNGILPKARILENRRPIIEELEWLESSPIKIVTMANYELAKLAQKYAPSLNLVVSSFSGVDSKIKFDQWARLPNVKNIYLDCSTYRNLPFLEELVKVGKEQDIGVRVIANLGCMADCIRKEEHAIIKDVSSTDKDSLHYAPCTFYCMKSLLEAPEQFLRLPIIRPEDLDVYSEIGIESVKIVDRVQKTSWIENVVRPYLNGKYEDNILELTCNYTRSSIGDMSNEQVAAIDMDEVMKSKEGVLKFREMLPELMKISIDPNYDLLACNNTCESCRNGCYDISAVKYDQKRREIVLAKLDKLENEYLFK